MFVRNDNLPEKNIFLIHNMFGLLYKGKLLVWAGMDRDLR